MLDNYSSNIFKIKWYRSFLPYSGGGLFLLLLLLCSIICILSTITISNRNCQDTNNKNQKILENTTKISNTCNEEININNENKISCENKLSNYNANIVKCQQETSACITK